MYRPEDCKLVITVRGHEHWPPLVELKNKSQTDRNEVSEHEGLGAVAHAVDCFLSGATHGSESLGVVCRCLLETSVFRSHH